MKRSERLLLWPVGLLIVTLASAAPPARGAEGAGERPDILLADFEGDTYGDWTTTGTAFGDGPARGTLPRQMEVSGYRGKGLASSYHGGDDATGTLTSPEFTLGRRYVAFLIGGGGFEGKTCMNLLVDGKVVRTATGPNTEPGGSEALAPASWDVGEFAGRRARLQVVDQATGGWGHISVDHIVLTDRKPPATTPWVRGASRTLAAEHHWLWFPIKGGAPLRQVRVLVDGRVERRFEAELADGEAEWWSPLDLDAWRGKQVTVRVDRLPENSAALTALHQGDAWEGAGLYREALRPRFHFSARRGWLNDPNGLVFHNGEYHLFFQHSPFSWRGAAKTWGHAVGPDLVHWRELDDEALWPDESGAMWSGSAVVDANDTSGLGSAGKPPLVLIYTAAGHPFTQCIASSTDGRTFTKFAGNPVLRHIVGGNRDPKVIWYAPGNRWVMALYLDKDAYALFGSADLKKWEKLGDVPFPGTNECPEFFPIALDGDSRQTRWVFYGGNGRYLVGRFDGKAFTPESGPHALHHGNCWYASQTFNGLPPSDGRRVLIPWGTIDLPGMPFNQMMGLPVELTLRATDEGPRLCAVPVRELASLRVNSRALEARALAPGEDALAGTTGELFDLVAELAVGDAAELVFDVRGVKAIYDVKKQELSCAGQRAPLAVVGGIIRLRLLVDRASIDLFGNDGRLYMPLGVRFNPENRSLGLSARGGAARIVSLQVHRMKSIWPQDPR